MLYTLPFISAFIGWVTNWLAIKMLFHPRNPIKIGPFVLQGIFPKRQAQVARQLGQVVATHLLSIDDLTAKLYNADSTKAILPIIEKRVDDFIEHKLTEELPLLSMFIKDKAIDNIKRGIIQEFESMFPELIAQVGQQIKTNVDIEKMISEKVAALDSNKLEELLVGIMKKEFVFIEVIGAVLGFIIGCIQLLLTL
jgi:uncharacterized membrane protein YheB (UPF0754 family)